MIDPKKNNVNDELIEALKDDEETVQNDNTSYSFKPKMRKVLLIVCLLTVLLIIIIWLLSALTSQKKSFADIEKLMITAGEKYYKNNKKLLPTGNKSTSEVSLQKLINNKYFKDIEKYNKKAKDCRGKVVVENNDDQYLYIAYLDCGKTYTTTELFREITKESNIVNDGEGLYYMNDEYVFRGDIVNNYVKLDDKLWRIVKVNSNGEVVLIYNDLYGYTYQWDNRYNSDKKLNYGYNNYKLSRIKQRLDNIYKESKSDTKKKDILLSKKTSKYLVGFNLCYGNVSLNQNVNNNTFECNNVIENTKIGLLTVSDYFNASLDEYCNTPASKSCQNYNYLTNIRKKWWLVNGNSQNSYEVYAVKESGTLAPYNASSYASVRPVIYLNNKTMFKNGKGSETNPYTIK